MNEESKKILKLTADGYLQALIDTQKVFNDLMENTIEMFKKKVEEIEKNYDN